MVEILSMLSMDIETLQAALLFPLADADVVSEDVLRESVGKSVVELIHGVRDMAAIRQLKATHTDSVSSEQVDNVRRMLLAMVDDFRCVVIKLAERVAHLREVKDAPEDERVLAAKECTNIYAGVSGQFTERTGAHPARLSHIAPGSVTTARSLATARGYRRFC
jgi:GTP pyrophosphokinase